MVSYIIASERQRGNPIIKHFNAPVEYDSKIKADYVAGSRTSILFLSMEYHKLKPDYIYNRMSTVGREFPLRVLLVVIDVDNPADAVKDLTRACYINDFTLILAWSSQEAASYIVKLKQNENTQGEIVKGVEKEKYEDQLSGVLTSMRGVNLRDVTSLSTEFGSFREILRNSKVDRLEKIKGLGPHKVDVISSTFNEPMGDQDLLVQSQTST